MRRLAYVFFAVTVSLGACSHEAPSNCDERTQEERYGTYSITVADDWPQLVGGTVAMDGDEIVVQYEKDGTTYRAVYEVTGELGGRILSPRRDPR
jgi:hypothetical protein